METDLESLRLGEKVISATRKIFKLDSKSEEIKHYFLHAKSRWHHEDVQKTFENLNRSIAFLEDKLGEHQTPRFRYTGK